MPEIWGQPRWFDEIELRNVLLSRHCIIEFRINETMPSGNAPLTASSLIYSGVTSHR
ncbi:hypothetical protein CERSUDRAFT_82903 [Gelatoporia subvermispora B]|uniref:Uncharacterized protein n=1 Tax=Ceriporiopsis subvermispora (strain B) TaxID=914234 RepID=M2RJI5_CERS8|nr:hypothetical protein CERSUDRAFT_82903 [Gelatoporia subvermispora B]